MSAVVRKYSGTPLHTLEDPSWNADLAPRQFWEIGPRTQESADRARLVAAGSTIVAREYVLIGSDETFHVVPLGTACKSSATCRASDHSAVRQA